MNNDLFTFIKIANEHARPKIINKPKKPRRKKSFIQQIFAFIGSIFGTAVIFTTFLIFRLVLI